MGTPSGLALRTRGQEHTSNNIVISKWELSNPYDRWTFKGLGCHIPNMALTFAVGDRHIRHVGIPEIGAAHTYHVIGFPMHCGM